MSVSHLIVLAVIALIVLGPEKLPEVARMAGKALAEFRRVTGDFRSTIEGEMRQMEQEVAVRELRPKFPEHAEQEQQIQEAAIETALAAGHATPSVPEAAPASLNLKADEAAVATASGKPSNGEPTPA